MSFLYRKIKPGTDKEWTVKDLDSVTFEAVELSFENSSGTEVVNISTAGALELASDLEVAGTVTAPGVAQTITTVVDASAGGIAQTTAVGTIPADSILLEVIAYVDAAFNGASTTTAEVGITGNIDKYIDTADFDATTKDTELAMTDGTNNDQKVAEFVTAASPVICTWTNNASATAGQITVSLVYIPIA